MGILPRLVFLGERYEAFEAMKWCSTGTSMEMAFVGSWMEGLCICLCEGLVRYLLA